MGCFMKIELIPKVNIVETSETLVSLSGDPDYIILHGNFMDVEYTSLHGLFDIVFRKHYYAKVQGDSVESNANAIFNDVMERLR